MKLSQQVVSTPFRWKPGRGKQIPLGPGCRVPNSSYCVQKSGHFVCCLFALHDPTLPSLSCGAVQIVTSQLISSSCRRPLIFYDLNHVMTFHKGVSSCYRMDLAWTHRSSPERIETTVPPPLPYSCFPFISSGSCTFIFLLLSN